jgi:DNA repair exonuclease SbcCD ATPase subunit
MMYIIYQELDQRQGPPLSSLPLLPFPSRPKTERATDPRAVNNELEQLRNNNRRLRSQSVILHHSQEVSQPDIHDLRQIVQVLKKENAELKRSRTLNDVKASGKDVQRGGTEDQHAAELLFDEMWGALKEKDAIISQLRQSHESFQDVSRQKLLLHTQVEGLKELLHSTKADHDVIQKLLQEDYNREVEELKRQVQELRDAAAPSVHEDQALQAVINQELSKENSNLRTRMDDLVSQVDALRNELTGLSQSEDGLRRENSELKRQLQEAQGRLSEVEELQRQIENLRRRNRHLRRDARGHTSTAEAESEGNPTEVLPSYEEVMA